jgi:hypothetical protein
MKSLIAVPTLNPHRLLIATVALVAGCIGFTSIAKAQSCQELWIERNSYYKEAGYCFRTAPAIQYFGNGGCIYDSEARVPLSRTVRARITEIKRLERVYGCND